MDDRGGLMIDLNQQGDATGEFENGQVVPASVHASQSVLLASSATQALPSISNSGPETMQIAISHRLRTNHVGAAADFVGEVGNPLKDGSIVHCTCCGKPETRKKTLICDLCGQSFHLRCLKLRESQASDLDEWLCLSCTAVQGKPSWPLGRVNFKQESHLAVEGSNGNLLAGQADEVGASGGLETSPPQSYTDGIGGSKESIFMVESGLPLGSSQKETFKRQKKGKDEELETDAALSRKVLGTNILDEPRTRVTRLKTLCRAKEDIQTDVQSSGRADVVDSVSAGEKNSSFTSANMLSKEVDGDMEASSKDTENEKLNQEHLQKLRDFLDQQGGRLDGDWTVNVKKRAHAEKAFDVLYFSPDKQKFRSKLEVARFLGVLDHRKEDANVREFSSSVGRGRKREVPQESQPSDGEVTKRRKTEAISSLESQDYVGNLEQQLPFQCMDLRVEALGVINPRPGYYNDHYIWPVGYRCSWHDGVTGSICVSEVIDGGRSSPIFRVTRRSCSEPDPCEKEAFSKESGMEVCQDATKAQAKPDLSTNCVYDEDDELSMLEGALTSFSDGDLSASLAANELWKELHPVSKESGSGAEDTLLKLVSHNSATASQGRKDEIGEIVVESSSPWGAWRLLAEQVVSRAATLYESGSFQLGCKHVESSLLSALGLNMEGPTQGRLHDAQFFFTKLSEWMGQDRFGFNIPVIQKYFEAEKAKVELPRPPPPLGWPICEKVSPDFVGDLLQIWEFLCRFADILGQKEPPTLEELEEIVPDSLRMDVDKNQQNKKTIHMTSQSGSQDGGLLQNDINMVKHVQIQEPLGVKRLTRSKPFSSPGCCSAALAASNVALLKIALSDLQQMVSGGGSDSTLEPKRGKKKEGEAAGSSKKQSASFMPLNDLTWPEVARRYVIGLLTLNLCGENLEISIEERRKILRCIQGDGGVLCGALDGVAAIEADALLLATAEKQLSRWLPGAEDKLNSESPAKGNPERKHSEVARPGGTSGKPAWAVVLEPVRKLATNVGARIRNCVREALEMNPPDWARETLEWSISKDVYKGNASGPTKRAVLSVLEKVADEKFVIPPPPKVEKKKVEYMVATPALVMKRCRIILRELITSDDVRVFCNSLGGTVLGYFEKEDDNIEVPLPLIARPLDFRMIDSRLAAWSYGDSHESYATDMRQLFQNIPVVFHDREDLIKVGQEMSQRFEEVYEEKVIKLVSGKEEIGGLKETNQMDVTEGKGDVAEDKSKLTSKESDEELKKAPWEEGVCKICGIDKDDDSTLLCDGCDAEYHIYCLEPPLSMIPEGNWYCPACVAGDQGDLSSVAEPSRTIKQLHRSRLSEDGSILSSLVRSMDGKDYWHLTGSERVQLLKFLCDKVLESTSIRDHIDQCIEALPELQQKLRILLIERQASAGKGSFRTAEVPAVDNTDAATMPKKRGRKNMKFGTPILEENSRSQNGLELFKSPADSSSGYELDSTVGIVDGKMFERMFQSDSEPAVAMQHMWGDNQKQGVTGHYFHGTQLSRADDLKFDVPHMGANNPNVAQSQNGDIQIQSLVREKSVQSLQGNGVEAHGSLSTAPLNLRVVDEQKGTSGVPHTDKGLIPLDTHYAGEIQVSPLPHVQPTPGKTAAQLLEEEIQRVEGELMKMAPRRECLGRDGLGRTYWALGWAGKYPWVLAEKGSAAEINVGAASCNRVDSRGQPDIQEWSGYYDGECMEQLLKWLKPSIDTERILKATLTKWCLLWSSKYKKEPDKQQSAKTRYVVPVSANTKAATILTKKFGSISQPEGPGEEPRKRGRKKKSLVDGKIYRCDCLELVWTTRIHCPCCHHTYDAIAELQGHNNGTCSWRGFEDESEALILAKAKKSKSKGQDFQPLDLSLIIKRFTVHTSNRARILQVGYLGDKGPRFVPAPPVSPLLDPALHMAASASTSMNMKMPETRQHNVSIGPLKDKIQTAGDTAPSLTNDGSTDNHGPDSGIPKEITTSNSNDQHKDVSGSRNPEEFLIVNRGHGLLALLPPSQPLLMTNMWAFKKLKASLLDIESLLSTDIVEPSRSEPNRRRAWRSFVKSAASILELVQSLTLLEQMVKASCLKDSWCNWTSLSAGFGINTLCSLALRIYSLDAAIKYKRSSIDPDTDDSEKPIKLGRKKKMSAGQV